MSPALQMTLIVLLADCAALVVAAAGAVGLRWAWGGRPRARPPRSGHRAPVWPALASLGLPQGDRQLCPPNRRPISPPPPRLGLRLVAVCGQTLPLPSHLAPCTTVETLPHFPETVAILVHPPTSLFQATSTPLSHFGRVLVLPDIAG